MNILEILFIAALGGGLLIPSAVTGQWGLFSVLAVAVVGLIIGEIVSIKLTDKTISMHFWEYSENNKTGAWSVVGGLIIAIIALVWHLIIRMI